jgi:hypothetical protein
MRKLILMTVLSLFSAFAFSQETTPAEAANPVAVEGTPGPSNAAESAAKTFGSWLGRVVKTPVGLVKSLASGVREGYSGQSDNTKVASTANTTTTPAPVAVPAAPEVAASSVPVTEVSSAEVRSSRNVFALVRDRLAAARSAMLKQAVGTQAPAPVEDRSVRDDVAVN